MAASAWLEAYAENHPKIGRIGKDVLSLGRIRVPEKPSTFPPRAQRNVFRRRDVRQQSRSFARENPPLDSASFYGRQSKKRARSDIFMWERRKRIFASCVWCVSVSFKLEKNRRQSFLCAALAEGNISLKQRDHLVQRLNGVRHASFHRGRNTQRLVNPAKVVMHRVEHG
jgi:hypothetical protein